MDKQISAMAGFFFLGVLSDRGLPLPVPTEDVGFGSLTLAGPTFGQHTLPPAIFAVGECQVLSITGAGGPIAFRITGSPSTRTAGCPRMTVSPALLGNRAVL